MPYAKAASASQLPTLVLDCLVKARQKNQQVVLVTGVFDILHQEHKHFLEKAKAIGGILIVGLESDVRVKQLKGPNRPVNAEQVRWQNLTDWQLADCVFVLPDQFNKAEDYVTLIETIRPQILAVSAHTPHLDRKQAVMARVNGEVRVVHEHVPSVSTTQIIAAQQN